MIFNNYKKLRRNSVKSVKNLTIQVVALSGATWTHHTSKSGIESTPTINCTMTKCIINRLNNVSVMAQNLFTVMNKSNNQIYGFI